MKKNHAGLILKIAALVCVLVFAAGVLIYGLSTGFGFSDFVNTIDNGVYADPYIYEEEVKTLRGIEVDWISGPVTLKFYDGETVQVTETAKHALDEDEKLYLEVSGGELLIRWNSSWLQLGVLRDEAKQLEILIPQAFYEDLDSVQISTASGDIGIDGLEAAEARFESVSGALHLSNVTAESFSAVTTSGEIFCENISGEESFEAGSTSGDLSLTNISGGKAELDNTSGAITLEGVFTELECGTVSGNIELDLAAWPEAMEIDSVSGGVEILAPETEDGFLCNFSSVSGDFTCGFETKKSGGLYQYGEGRFNVDIDTTSGNASLNKKVG